MEQLGRYQIAGELGHGAMGVVFRAHDPSIGREVALKTIRLGDLANPEQRSKQRDRLFREARSAGILSHPHIVTIYDVGEQDGVAYIAMEVVRGPTVEHMLGSSESLGRDQIFAILRQTAEALDFAHRKGIIHRDVKPANLMVDESGVVKITDFGIAKISTLDQLTQIGLIMGTPNYMAPEQVQGRPVNGRADQYSLGVIAYEMFTGEKPFVAEQLPALVYRIVMEEPAPPARLNPSLGGSIDTVLLRALAKGPDARYENCLEFIEALEEECAKSPDWQPLPRGGSLTLPTMTSAVVQADLPLEPPKPAPAMDLPPPRPSRPLAEDTPARKTRAFPMAAAVLFGLGIAGLSYYLGRPVVSEPPPPPPKTEAPRLETQAPPPAAPSVVEEVKPVAETPKPETPVAETVKPPESSVPVRAPASVEVPIRTEPPGARVTMDDLPGTACSTPCILKAAPGPHKILIVRAGFRDVTRELRVTPDMNDPPTINLMVASAVIMLQSRPTEATIYVNDERHPQKTPAQLTLKPGSYRLRLEKDDLKVSETIELKDGDLRQVTIPLAP